MSMYEYPIMTERDNYKELDLFWNQVKAKRIFLVCDDSVLYMPIGQYFHKLEKRTGITVIRFSEFRTNPTHDAVIKGIEAFQREQCDLIAAVGGGSAIDVAKCIRLHYGRNINGNQQGVPSVKFLAVPTTAGTGSEATRFAVIYYHGEKKSVEDRLCIPSAVLMDPSALLTLPEYQRKATMMDALCHGLESFWSVNSTEDSRKCSEESIHMILKYKDSYLANEPEGNAGMLYAANIAGRAINIAKTTAGHAMCYKLTSMYGIAHGHAAALCVARLWPYMVSHIDRCIDKRGRKYLENIFENIAEAMGCPGIYDAINKFAGIVKELELTAPQLRHLNELEMLKVSVNLERLKNNPVWLGENEIGLLYHQILKGD